MIPYERFIMTKVRKIDCHYLVYCEEKPVMFTPDKNKASALVQLIQQKNKTSTYKSINGTEERLEEIGKNLFERTKSMSESQIHGVLTNRNKVVIELIDYQKENKVSEEVAWVKVAKKHNLYSNFKTMQDFSQWALDIVEYYNVQR
jgi:16S rRNA A1518/A1519 N6-dimethyltransferase RsmA/KsgA/DIM1 with predicted DNA glycosylase/AP lyase activity